MILGVVVVCLLGSSAFGAPRQHIISGFVQTSGGSGVEGVSIVGDNGAGSAVTDVNGAYSVTVPNNWSGTVTVTKSGWLITPASKTYSNIREDIANENYVAYQPKISGYVKKADGTALSGATVSASGGASTITNVSGYYEIIVPYNWSGTVTPSKTGWGFSPASGTYSNVINDQINQDYTAFQPVISGYVRDNGGAGVAAVSITANNGWGNTVTDSGGYYAISVPYDWSGTVTASKAGFNITPASIAYSNVINDQSERNYTAFQPTISGVITSYGASLEGVILTASNGGGTAVTDSAGSYNLTVPYGWSGTITPSKPQYTFSPVNKVYSNVIADTASQNYTAILPPVSISGYVRDGSGNGVVGVNIAADNGGGSVVTNSSGYYSISVPYNWSGAVKANRGGWQITPASYSYINLSGDQVDQNFNAIYTGIIIVITVKADGTGDYPTIQAAIDAAAAGDVVILQTGTYTGNGNRDIDFKGKAITVKGATGDPNTCIIDCQGTSTSPHRGFKFVSGETTASVLEAIKIINGYGPNENRKGAPYSAGGAIFCKGSAPTVKKCILSNNSAYSTSYYGLGGGICNFDGSNPTITDCTVVDNSAEVGTGVYSENSSPDLSNCTISGNLATYWGGGIYDVNSSSKISKCTFANNEAYGDGGGIYNSSSSPNINNCTFSDNSAGWDGGGICNNYNSSPYINNCTITNNSTYLDGGGIYNYRSNPRIENCTFNANTADTGGGINNFESSPNIDNCTLSSNSAVRYGGGIFNYDYAPSIKNCALNNNSADEGGGIYNKGGGAPSINNCILSYNSADTYGGGIYTYDGFASVINNCTIYGNWAGEGGGIYDYYYAHLTIANSIVWDNSSSQISGFGITVNYCDIQGGYAGAGNINAIPYFANSSLNDFHLKSK
jgi:hypothetical protein